MAVFYGNFVPQTTYNAEGKRCTDIDASNYREMGRSKIALLGKQHPELLHARMSVYNNFNYVFANDTDGLGSFETMSSCEQAKRFKYVVYAEGACGWADRLKTLMLYNSTLLMQTTTCHEYYSDLMKPYEHYIPVKANYDDLVEKIQWARDHDAEAMRMAQKALEVGIEYMTPDKMRCYMNLLFDKYRKLMKYVPSKKLLVQKYTGSI